MNKKAKIFFTSLSIASLLVIYNIIRIAIERGDLQRFAAALIGTYWGSILLLLFIFIIYIIGLSVVLEENDKDETREEFLAEDSTQNQ